jgi:hypothetical protein
MPILQETDLEPSEVAFDKAFARYPNYVRSL